MHQSNCLIMKDDIAGYPWAYPQVFQKRGLKYSATVISTFIVYDPFIGGC